MAVLFDYECSRCRRILEIMAEPSERILPCPECKEGKAERVYLRMSAMPGKNKGKFPAFDVQSGQTFQSSKDRDDYAYKRGRFEHRDGPKMEMLGVEEFDRSRHAAKSPHPWDSDEPDDQLIEIAKKAWDDVKYDRVPKEVEEDRVMDVVKQSDFLDVTKAPKIEKG